jgi:choline monooxygenase
MSDLGRLARQRFIASQLPVASYFDPAFFQRERETLFKHAPAYVGHELMVPEIGSYQTLAADKQARALIRSAQGIECISNVCRHRQAIMLQGRGQTDNIVCPLHRWTYDLQGQLIGAPHFPEQPCAHLQKTPLKNWHGLLFEGPHDVAKDFKSLGCASRFNFDGYKFDSVQVHECNYNWKTFIEVYLEDYHVEPFHPGLGQFVNCDTLDWEFKDQYSVQTVGVHRALGDPGTPVYKRWHDQVLRYNKGVAPEHGAIWLTYFPNVMLEWYPNVLVVSSLIARGPRHTTNVVEFYYPEDIVLFEREFVEAQQAAYMETCAEDDEIAIRMDGGRQLLYERGEDDAGPYQSPMEDGMRHFHEYVRREMGLPAGFTSSTTQT